MRKNVFPFLILLSLPIIGFASDFKSQFIETAILMTEEGRSQSKQEVIDLIKEVNEKGVVVRGGLDQENRPCFVGAQAEFERTLICFLDENRIENLIGIIHTPAPATPLCTSGGIARSLIHSSLVRDEKRLYTVWKRFEVIDEYLRKGGHLIAAYPEGGKERRTKRQQKVFESKLEKYGANLFEKVLKVPLSPDMCGALYLFSDPETQEDYAFAIRASQAIDPKDDEQWGFWFGNLDQCVVRDRVNAVLGNLFFDSKEAFLIEYLQNK